MNLNVMLLIFVLAGFTFFKATFEAEMTDTENTSAIQTLSESLVSPTIDTDSWDECSDFFACGGALFNLIGQFIAAIAIMIYDVFIFAALLVIILIIPLPEAPIWVNLIIYTLELGGIYVIIGMFRGGE